MGQLWESKMVDGGSNSLIFVILVTVSWIDGAYGATRYGYGGGCNSCGGGGNGAYNTGRNIGAAVSGAVHNKIQGVAGFVDGLLSGPAQSGCGGCSSSCGSPGCGSHYVPSSNSCPSNSCYSGCGSHGCGSSHSHSSSSSSCSCGSSSSGSTTVIVVQQQSLSYSQSSNCRSYFQIIWKQRMWLQCSDTV